MSASRQLGLGPMALNGVASAVASPSKVLGSTPLVDVAVRAFVRTGYNAQQSAGLLEMTPANFSKAFSPNWRENNPVMKKWDALPFNVRRELAALLCADFDLTAADTEQTRVLSDFARLLKAVG